MKAIITGHTSGIGQGIYDALVEAEWEVEGFSKSTGWDINDRENIDRLANHADDVNADVLVNNAYHPWYQTDLLYALFDKWQNKKKTIINISSNAGEMIVRPTPHKYAICKAALSNACVQLQFLKTDCKVIDVKFGYADTDRVAHVEGVKKLTVDDVAKQVQWILNQPDDIHIKSISFAKK